MTSLSTMSGQDGHLSRQKLLLPVILNGPVNRGPKIYFFITLLHFKRTSIHFAGIMVQIGPICQVLAAQLLAKPPKQLYSSAQYHENKQSYSHFLLHFYQLLDLLHLYTKFLQKSMLGSFTTPYDKYRILRVCKKYLESCCYEFGQSEAITMETSTSQYCGVRSKLNNKGLSILHNQKVKGYLELDPK